MPNNLNVTLDKSVDPWAVDVDQHGKDNEVAKGPNAQTITWHLSGNAASGSFVSLTDPNPGFEWIEQPPDGIFNALGLSQNSKRLSITDLNNSSDTAGEWHYRLRVNVGGTVYSTREESIKREITNPWIRNKP